MQEPWDRCVDQNLIESKWLPEREPLSFTISPSKVGDSSQLIQILAPYELASYGENDRHQRGTSAYRRFHARTGATSSSFDGWADISTATKLMVKEAEARLRPQADLDRSLPVPHLRGGRSLQVQRRDSSRG